MPDWGRVAELMTAVGLPARTTRQALAELAEVVVRLPDTMQTAGVDAALIQRLDRQIIDVAALLRAARPTTGGKA